VGSGPALYKCHGSGTLQKRKQNPMPMERIHLPSLPPSHLRSAIKNLACRDGLDTRKMKRKRWLKALHLRNVDSEEEFLNESAGIHPEVVLAEYLRHVAVETEILNICKV
jgi:hypothetical protein